MLSIDEINKLESENKRLNKELETAITQYDAVVMQNKDLQKELNYYKKAQEKNKKEQDKDFDLVLFKCAHILKFNDIAIIKPMVYDIQEIIKRLKEG